MDSRRLLDITLGSVGLAVSALPIAFMALVSFCESGQAGLLRETRYGLNGKAFRILKVRTLTRERQPYPVSGLWRRVELDELPQLWNVLRGDMTIIGPRPVDRLIESPEWNHKRMIKPGMTGPATVMSKEPIAGSSPVSVAEADRRYIDRRLAAKSCIRDDLDIVLRSFKVILSCRGDIRQSEERANLGAPQHY